MAEIARIFRGFLNVDSWRRLETGPDKPQRMSDLLWFCCRLD